MRLGLLLPQWLLLPHHLVAPTLLALYVSDHCHTVFVLGKHGVAKDVISSVSCEPHLIGVGKQLMSLSSHAASAQYSAHGEAGVWPRPGFSNDTL